MIKKKTVSQRSHPQWDDLRNVFLPCTLHVQPSKQYSDHKERRKEKKLT